MAQLAQQGELSYNASWKRIPENGDRYLLLTKTIDGFEVQVTVNQTENSGQISRRAKCRNALSQNNQLSLFGEDNDDNFSKIYLELNHGYYYNAQPSFIVLGLPAKGNVWIAKKTLPLVAQKSTMKRKPEMDLVTNQDIEFTPDELFNNPEKKRNKEKN